MVNFDNVAQLVRNVLEEDPIPFQNINLNTADSINFVANSIWDKYQTEWKLVSRDKTEELMLAVLIKVVAENFYLHTKLLMLGETDFQKENGLSVTG